LFKNAFSFFFLFFPPKFQLPCIMNKCYCLDQCIKPSLIESCKSLLCLLGTRGNSQALRTQAGCELSIDILGQAGFWAIESEIHAIGSFLSFFMLWRLRSAPTIGVRVPACLNFFPPLSTHLSDVLDPEVPHCHNETDNHYYSQQPWLP
jgi:hypothetical protein